MFQYIIEDDSKTFYVFINDKEEFFIDPVHQLDGKRIFTKQFNSKICFISTDIKYMKNLRDANMTLVKGCKIIKVRADSTTEFNFDYKME
ncbi:MAG: hypothetical protein AABY32_01320 [Nanoarchaeota archaeon]